MKDAILRQLMDKALQDFVSRKGIGLPEDFDYDFVVTKDPDHGDFSANTAFKLAKFAGQKPGLVADELVLLIENNRSRDAADIVNRIQVAGAGFINFYLSKASLAEVLLEVHRKDRHYGQSDFGQDQKVLIEFVSANPTGPLTIAHGRQAAVGDCIARILKATGHSVKTEYYLNDAGRQMNLLGASLHARYCQSLERDVQLPEDGYQGEYLLGIAKKLADQEGQALLGWETQKAVEFCRKFAGDEIMKGIREDLSKVDVL